MIFTCTCVLHVLQVSLTRSPPMRSVDDQGEGLLLNSYDRTLVIKQISSEDVADMHSILSEYHQVRSGWLKEKSGVLFYILLIVNKPHEKTKNQQCVIAPLNTF